MQANGKDGTVNEISEQVGEAQKRNWNGSSGNAWIDLRELLDGMFAGIERTVAEAAVAAAGEEGSVLDVGCGTGATTLAITRRLGDGGRCHGVDISAPMIAVARERAEQERLAAARFTAADAQRHAFEPASVDAIVSRFGVMFFPDPVAAFENLWRAARPGGQLRLVVWRGAADNPFMTTAERAAAPLLPALPPRDPDGPGQFAFGDPARVRAILEQAGWEEIALDPLDVPCALPEPALLTYLSRLGPVGMALDQVDDARVRQQVLTAVRAAFEPFVHGEEIRFTAACWIVRAARP